jgi:hypothetical protein
MRGWRLAFSGIGGVFGAVWLAWLVVPSAARADAGFDVGLEELRVSGATSFADAFDDGERDAAPTRALRDRGATRVHEVGGALRLTHADGAEYSAASGRWSDRIFLDRPFRRHEGETEIVARFAGTPMRVGQAFGLAIARGDAGRAVAPLVEFDVRASEDAAVPTSAGAGQGASPGSTCGEAGSVAGRVAIWLHAPGGSGCSLVDREELSQGITLRLVLRSNGALEAGFALGTAPYAAVALQHGTLAGSSWPRTLLATSPLVAGVFASGPGGPGVPPRGFLGVAGEGDLERNAQGAITRAAGELFAARQPGRGPDRPEAALARFELEAAPGGDAPGAPIRVRFEGEQGDLVAEALQSHPRLRRDPVSGRPIAPDAPAQARCENGSETACLPPGSLRHGALALRAEFVDAALATLPFGIDPAPPGDPLPVSEYGLSAAAQALLGCGPHFGTRCSACSVESGAPTGLPFGVPVPMVRCPTLPGVELLGAEAGALLSSFVPVGAAPISWVFPGPQPGTTGYEVGASPGSQPGTISFEVVLDIGFCMRHFSPGSVGNLSGCGEGPLPRVPLPVLSTDPTDLSIGFPGGSGLSTPALGSTFLGPQWGFLGGVPWGAQMFLVGLSRPADAAPPGEGLAPFFDPAAPYREDGCSYVLPWACDSVAALRGLTATPLAYDVMALPVLRFVWEDGASLRIVTASGRFAELAGGLLHASAPLSSDAPGAHGRVIFHATPPPIVDADADDVADANDRCLGLRDPMQRDSDGDGFGNPCDADLDGNGITNFADLAILRARFFTRDANADFDGDGLVGIRDLMILGRRFGRAPGPSAPAR